MNILTYSVEFGINMFNVLVSDCYSVAVFFVKVDRKTSVESMCKTEYKAIYLPETKLLFDKNILLSEHSRAIHIK